MSTREMPQPQTPIPDLDKEVVRLPDGRELTFYRFPEDPAPVAPRPAPAQREGR